MTPKGCESPGNVPIRVGVPPFVGSVKMPAGPLLMNSVDPSGETFKSFGPAFCVPKGGPDARVVGEPPAAGRLKTAPTTLSATYNVEPSGETAIP